MRDMTNSDDFKKNSPSLSDMDDRIINGSNEGQGVRVSNNPLLKGLEYLNTDDTSLRAVYEECDLSALNYQRKHKKVALLAIFCGFIAVLFAVVQFCFLTLHLEIIIPFSKEVEALEIIRIFEVLAIILASIAVISGLFLSFQKQWLINRHIAERCRLLKFRSLISPSFWDESRFSEWKHFIDEKLANLKNQLDNNRFHQIESWIEDDKIPKAPTIGICSYSTDAKIEFIDYYRKTRLHFLMDYYIGAYKRFHKSNVRTKRIPHLLFFSSVVAVLAHFIVDIIGHGPIFHIISITLIGLAVTLPFIGAVIKTQRDTFQVGRSAALYHAKYTALKDLDEQLSGYEEKVEENWENILQTLWECENFLEAEHREWLILVHDTEWFL